MNCEKRKEVKGTVDENIECLKEMGEMTGDLKISERLRGNQMT
jgi:hypothetical protein